jgi:hypothetical protein
MFLPEAALMLGMLLSGGTGFLGNGVYVAAASNIPVLAVRLGSTAALVILPLVALRGVRVSSELPAT